MGYKNHDATACYAVNLIGIPSPVVFDGFTALYHDSLIEQAW